MLEKIIILTNEQLERYTWIAEGKSIEINVLIQAITVTAMDDLYEKTINESINNEFSDITLDEKKVKLDKLKNT